ncbi:hypothetical protein C8F01DRAFT_1146748, partial [Mycena amicta]
RAGRRGACPGSVLEDWGRWETWRGPSGARLTTAGRHRYSCIWSVSLLWLVHRGRGTLGSKIAVPQNPLARPERGWESVGGWIMAQGMAPRKHGAFAMVIWGPRRQPKPQESSLPPQKFVHRDAASVETTVCPAEWRDVLPEHRIGNRVQ